MIEFEERKGVRGCKQCKDTMEQECETVQEYNCHIQSNPNPTSFCNCFLVHFQVRPKEMRSLHKFDDEGKLQIEEGDLITVIDGR